jgi:hypothetical protein
MKSQSDTSAVLSSISSSISSALYLVPISSALRLVVPRNESQAPLVYCDGARKAVILRAPARLQQATGRQSILVAGYSVLVPGFSLI